MDLEQLRQLDAIAKCGTLSATSRHLHISQPAISRSMQRLENELGQQLFTRTKNRLHLNEAGQIALEYARAILREEREMREAFDRLGRRERTLVIGTMAPAPIWRLTETVVSNHPGTVFQIKTVSQEEATQGILDRTIDIAATVRPIELPTCTSRKFFEEHLYVVVPADHPLASSEYVTFEQLDGESFLVDAAAGFWIDTIRSRMPHAHFVEQTDRGVLLRLLGNSGMLSFATNETVSWGVPKGMVHIAVQEPDASVTFYIAMRTDASGRTREIVGQALAGA